MEKPRCHWVYRGLSRDARALDVNIRTLRRALTGEWKLPGLVRRYEAMKISQNAENNNPKEG